MPLRPIVVRGYYAIQNTLFPAIYSTIGVLISVPFYILGMKLMGAGGVALAISISAIFQVTLLYTLWNRRSKNPESRDVYRGYVKMLLLSIPIGMILEGLRMGTGTVDRPEKGLSGKPADLLAASAWFFCFCFSAAGYLFKIREITETFRRLLQKAI